MKTKTPFIILLTLWLADHDVAQHTELSGQMLQPLNHQRLKPTSGSPLTARTATPAPPLPLSPRWPGPVMRSVR